VIHGANRHDMKLVKPTLADLKLDRPRPTAFRTIRCSFF
jgi:hypothetical protein